MSGMEARRIICQRGHVTAVLKTDPGFEGDDQADRVISAYNGGCIYCGDGLRFEAGPLADFEHWASREDRYQGNGAPMQ